MKMKFDYKWIIVSLCILMVMVYLGFVSSTKALFPDEIAKALGAPVMNLCYDIFETYVPAIMMVGFIMCAVFVLIQFVISAAHKERRFAEIKETSSAVIE